VIVTSERSRDSENAVGGYRVSYSAALLTEAGPVPLTGSFGRDQREYQRLADAIFDVLAMPAKAASAEDEIQRLVAAGRMIEAVTMFRAQSGLGLAEALNRADQLKREQSAARERAQGT
jgi:hypothetical protein